MAQGRSGLMSVTGHPGTGPVKVGVPVVDVITGLYAAIGALGALLGVRDGGPAMRVEVPLLECGVASLVNQAANHLVGGLVPGLLGNGHPNVVPYGPMPTADGEIIVGATGERQFAALCAVLDLEHLPGDPRFAANRDRLRHRDELNALLAEVFARETTATWQDRLTAAGVPSAPVNRVDQVFAEPQITGGDLVREVEHPAGPVRLVTSPLTLNGRRPPVRRVPPLLGEHTRDVTGTR
jgi:crotonobetainyl-CoA:carnitine CoA-transferase CaiB-like acyl-CoA transferase